MYKFIIALVSIAVVIGLIAIGIEVGIGILS